jgi:CBS domain-containing protein
MSIGAMCDWRVVTVNGEDSIRLAAKKMKDKNVGSVIVVDGKRPTGILTDRDIALRIVAAGKEADIVKAADIMTKITATIHENMGVMDACALFGKMAVRRLPIVNAAGDLKGIVSVDDLFDMLARELANIASAVAPRRAA